MNRHCLLALAVSGVVACTPAPPAHTPGPCSPLGGAGACLAPYPSSYFEVDDATTATGRRVLLPRDAMPKNVDHKPIDPSRFNRLDGFSPATPIVLLFPKGADVSGLATVHDFSPSLAADAPIRLFNMTTGERVDYFAELDAMATGTPDRQALLVRPQHRLQPATRYAVAVLGVGAAPDTFVEVRDSKLTPDSALWTMKDRYDALFAFLDQQGVSRGQLTLAWDFTTASEDMITGRLLRMRDRALDAATFGYHVDSATDVTDGGPLLREVVGTFQVPSFLTSDAGTATLPADAGADPAIITELPFPFVAHIPACARSATGPLPVMIYGHGLLGNAITELNDTYQPGAINSLCMVQIATNWIGLSHEDVPTLVSVVVTDFGRFPIISDRLMQAQVNAVILTRLVKTKLLSDAAFAVDGHPVSDASERYYEGISLGAIMGTTFMAIDPDIERGVTNVGGGEWNLMMSRSSDFAGFQFVFQATYPDPFDQQISLALSQSLWDETDPISYAPHVLHDPLRGVGAKKLLVQEAEGDSQVPNLSTRLLARTEGLAGLAPLVVAVPGIPEQSPPLDSAYVQFDTHPMPLPPADDNELAPQNSAHQDCRRLDAVNAQIRAFLKPNGSVQQFCTGACDPD
jgi:hypothetical protein